MRFNIFSVWEIIGKKLIWVIIIIVSIVAVAFYFFTNNFDTTYIAATTYAMFLFLVGIILSNMDKKINLLLYRRKEYYLTLKILNDVFETRGQMETDNEMFKFIVLLWTWTGRGSCERNKHPVIRENGFRFKTNLYKMECNYYNKYNDFQNSFFNDINNYIDNNKIKSKERFSELLLLGTNYEEWVLQNIEDEGKREEVITYIYSLIAKQQELLDEIEIDRKHLKKYYDRCNKKLVWNIKRIEKLYGDALQNLVYGDEQMSLVIEEVKTRLEEVTNKECEIEYSINERLSGELNRHTQEVLKKIDTVCYDLVNEIKCSIDENL